MLEDTIGTYQEAAFVQVVVIVKATTFRPMVDSNGAFLEHHFAKATLGVIFCVDWAPSIAVA